MNARFRIVLATAAVCIGVSVCAAQDFDYEIRLTNGERYANVALVELGGDTLHFLHKKNFPDWVLLDSLTEIRRERTGAILPATIIGGAGGGAIGFALKPVARDQEQADIYSAAFGFVVGGVAGFFLGSKILPDEVYDLATMDREAKTETMSRITKPKPDPAH